MGREQNTKNLVNEFMKNSADGATAERSLLQAITEKLLMSTNSYRGFNYLYWSAQGFNEWMEAGEPDFPEKDKYIYGPSGDRTRIFFY